MKKCAVATVVLLVAGLTGCSSGDDSADGSATTPATTTSSTVTSSESTSAVPPPSDSTSQTSQATGGTLSGSTYCKKLTSAQSQFDHLNFQALGDDQFATLSGEFDDIASVAPSAVKGDWATLSSALKRIRQILASAGLSFDDLRALSSSGQVPDGVTATQLRLVGQQLEHFAKDQSFARAAAEIATDAKAECGIALTN
jgi:hypothetical protein